MTENITFPHSVAGGNSTNCIKKGMVKMFSCYHLSTQFPEQGIVKEMRTGDIGMVHTGSPGHGPRLSPHGSPNPFSRRSGQVVRLSVILFTGGRVVCLSACWDTPLPLEQTPLPGGDTPPPPPGRHQEHPHPTGMYTC